MGFCGSNADTTSYSVERKAVEKIILVKDRQRRNLWKEKQLRRSDSVERNRILESQWAVYHIYHVAEYQEGVENGRDYKQLVIQVRTIEEHGD